MGNIPLPALGIRPPQEQDPVGQYGRLVALKGMLQQQPLALQSQQLQVAQQQRQAQYEQNLQNLWTKPTPPTDEDILQAGGPTYGPAIIKSRLDIQKTRTDLQKAQDEHQSSLADHLGNLANAIKQNGYDPQKADTLLAAEAANPDQEYAQHVQQFRQQIQQDPSVLRQLTDQVLAQAPGQQKQATQLEAARIRAAGHPPETETPLGDKLSQYQQLIDQRWKNANPNAPTPQFMRLGQDATIGDYNRIDKSLSSTEQFLATKEQRDISNSFRQQALSLAEGTKQLAQGQKEENRLDKSYQFNTQQLDQLSKPIESINPRISRLNDTLNQHNPQADALVAPELLSIMSGGQGSGLRMNEAEISRIVGGRSAWENLKASIQHWSTDPNAARSITPAQDAQIRALVQTVQGRTQAKQAALDDARTRLSDPNATVETHRKIVDEARSKLSSLDSGHYVGEQVTIKGQPLKITAVHPDGSFDAQ